MLTTQQIEEIRKKANLSTTTSSNNYPGKYDNIQATDKKNNILNDLSNGLKNIAEGVKDNANKIADTYAVNKNLPATALSSTAIVPKAIGDTVFSAIKYVLPKSFKENIKSFIYTVANNPEIKDKIIEPLNNFAKNNPQQAQAVQDLLDIASVIPTTKATELGITGVKKGVISGVESSTKLGKQAVKISNESVSGLKNTGTKLLNKSTDLVTPIESGVKTVLSKPEVKLPKLVEYEKSAKEALKDYSKPTPLELAGDKANNALGLIKKKLDLIGGKKSAITKEIGSINTGNIVNEARDNMRSLLKDRTGIQFTDNGVFKNAPGRLNTISDAKDIKMIRDIDFKLKQLSKNPTLQKVDDSIDWFQDALYKRGTMTAIPVNKKVEGIIKQTIGDLNRKLKTIGGEKYSLANTSYKKTKEIFDTLNKALGQEGNKGASLMKQLFSPNSTAPRKLFEQVKELTGIDLVDEATLAKFVMENVGDVRQASLLEQVIKGNIPSSSRGLIQIAAEKTIGKLQNPIGKAKRLIQK